MIGQERSSDRNDCISFFNELRFVFIRSGDIYGRTSFVIQCKASMKRNG